jgi:isoleucyl-tRNA synthetase
MDFKDTVYLPKTTFPMRANLSQKEPEILASWVQQGIYDRLQSIGKGNMPFILHDGPPYSNGHVHLGHALNKILKDIIMKSQRMQGKYCPYVPGWDCHGLPIEWMIETQYRKEGKNKDEVSLFEFRQECRQFSQKWVDIQKQEFQRLGVLGDWGNPYLTMNFESEACIIQELYKFLLNGSLYKGAKPVQWSTVEKTALAEAEVEYQDKVSPALYVAFPISKPSYPELEGAFAVIWTTTPWTLPGNRAIAYGSDIDYAVVVVKEAAAKNAVGKKLIIARDLIQKVLEALGATESETLAILQGSQLEGTIALHPWYQEGYDFPVPLLSAEHVTVDQGTGLVHTAPSHGIEDFAVGVQYQLEIPQTVGDDGTYYSHVPLFAGKHIFKDQEELIESLNQKGALLKRSELKHSYPHSWRSKAPLIFRLTPQWFISMEKTELRDAALKAIDEVTWIPAQGKNRIRAMVESRPDWCISRQRAWGVPIALFMNKKTGEPLKDATVNARIVEVIRQEGCDVWFKEDAAHKFLSPEYNPEEFEKVVDILDVWFESGCTHSFVLEKREGLSSPADIYVEGSDQHRGWFQSSLLQSTGSRGHAPFKAVLTHGFIVDAKGYKMSKSAGNSVTLEEIIKNHGADILRLWVIGSDYSEDLRVGNEILKRQEDIYRRLRNTLRYLLGNLSETPVGINFDFAGLPELEQWVLHRLSELDQIMREKAQTYDLHGLFRELYHFCAVDLSAFYFDIRKDALYCDNREGKRCQQILSVLNLVFECLTRWLAPIISFTAEEAWRTRHGDDSSVHEQTFLPLPSQWRNPELGEKWQRLREIRRVATGALELERVEKRLGSSLQGHIKLYVEKEECLALFQGLELAELFIASSGEILKEKIPDNAFILEDISGVGVIVEMAAGEKCDRCWRILPEVKAQPSHLCKRCEQAVHSIVQQEIA